MFKFFDGLSNKLRNLIRIFKDNNVLDWCILFQSTEALLSPT